MMDLVWRLVLWVSLLASGLARGEGALIRFTSRLCRERAVDCVSWTSHHKTQKVRVQKKPSIHTYHWGSKWETEQPQQLRVPFIVSAEAGWGLES